MNVLYCTVTFFVTVTLIRCHKFNKTTRVSKCIKNTGDLPISSYLMGCTIPPCALPQLQEIVAHVDFRAPRPIKSMRTYATAYLPYRFVTVPMRVDLGDSEVTCNYISNGHCPVEQGDVLQYIFKMYIESYFPVGTSAIAELKVEDQDFAPVFCIRVPFIIVSAHKNRKNGTNDTVH